jgi:hypothetical protein
MTGGNPEARKARAAAWRLAKEKNTKKIDTFGRRPDFAVACWSEWARVGQESPGAAHAFSNLSLPARG